MNLRKLVSEPVIAGCALLVLAGLSTGAAHAMDQQTEAKAFQLESKGDWRDLATLAQQALARNPTDAEAWFYAGAAAQELGRPRQAMADFARVQQYGSGPLKALAQTMIARANPAPMYQPAPQQAAAPPDFSPATLASLTVQVRRQWTRDAIPVSVIVQSSNSYILTVNYYSPSTRGGLMVTPQANGPWMQRVSDPRFGTVALPQNFKSLEKAIAAAQTGGASGRLDHAYLIWAVDATGPSDLSWQMWFDRDNKPTLVDAMALSSQEFAQLLAAAQRGDATAEYNLAMAYALGAGTTRDPARSVDWLKKAVAQGNVAAEYKLAQAYSEGAGVLSDPQEAFNLYDKAAKAGYGPAQYSLALLYERGGSVTDLATAERWLIQALHNGVQQAQEKLIEVRNEEKFAATANSPSMDALATRIAQSYCHTPDNKIWRHVAPNEYPVLFINPSDVGSYQPMVYCVFPGRLYVTTNPPLVGDEGEIQRRYGLPTNHRYYVCTKQYISDNVPDPGYVYSCSR